MLHPRFLNGKRTCLNKTPQVLKGDFKKTWTFMSPFGCIFNPRKDDSGFFGFVSPKKLDQLQSPRTSTQLHLTTWTGGKIRGPPWPTIFPYDWLLVVASPKKQNWNKKKAAARRQMCLNRFKTGKACQTQWSLVACSGGGPSTTIMLRGLAVLPNGKHWMGGERSLDVQVCCRF